MTRSRTTGALLLAVILAAVFFGSFALLQQIQGISPHIYGLEGYYHISVARMIRAGDLPRDFPWLHFTVFRFGYADLELLHHLVLGPLAGADDPDLLESRAKCAASLLGAALLTLFHFVLHRLRCRFALFWTAALVCGAGGFLLRLAQLRPENLQLLLLLAAALLFSRRRRHHWPHLLLGLLFALTGAVPQLVVGLSLLFVLGRRLVDRQGVDWKPPLFTLAGTAAGLLVHPDRWDLIRLVVLLNQRRLLAALIPGSGVPASVQAMERKPPALDQLLLHNELVVLPLAILLLVLLLRRAKGSRFTAETVSFGFCSLAALGLTAGAARYTLFWAAFTTIFSALLFRDLLAAAAPSPTRRPWVKALVPLLLLLGLTAIRTSDHVSDRLHAESSKAARHEIRQISDILDSEAGEGDLVFHTRWIHFPQFFFHAPRQYYLLGLDPMLMLAHGEQFLDLWQGLRTGNLADPYPFIRGTFGSHHVVAAKSQERLVRRLVHDPRFVERFRGRSLMLFTLREEDPGFITRWQAAPLTHEEPAEDPTLVPWHQPPSPDGIPLGFVDFRPLFPLGGMAPPAALAETVFRLEQPVIGARILLGSSGPFRLELDGEQLLMNRHEDRVALIDRWKRRVDLEAGEHRLRVVAARTPGDWGFFLRVVDASGRPMELDRP